MIRRTARGMVAIDNNTGTPQSPFNLSTIDISTPLSTIANQHDTDDSVPTVIKQKLTKLETQKQKLEERIKKEKNQKNQIKNNNKSLKNENKKISSQLLSHINKTQELETQLKQL